jgi:hypothetical protein
MNNGIAPLGTQHDPLLAGRLEQLTAALWPVHSLPDSRLRLTLPALGAVHRKHVPRLPLTTQQGRQSLYMHPL